MNARSLANLSVLPLFTLLALGSAAPKKGDLSSSDGGGVTTTSAVASAAPAAADEKPDNHCDLAADGICTESYWADEGDKTTCDEKHGAFEKGTSCPTRDTLLGTCTIGGKLLGAPMTVNKLYFYAVPGGRDLADAKQACGDHGPGGKGPGGAEIVYTWADGPGATKKAPAAVAKASPVKAPAKAKTKR